MVKQINIFLDDDEHEKIKKVKGTMTWIDFLKLSTEIIQKNKEIAKRK